MLNQVSFSIKLLLVVLMVRVVAILDFTWVRIHPSFLNLSVSCWVSWVPHGIVVIVGVVVVVIMVVVLVVFFTGVWTVVSIRVVVVMTSVWAVHIVVIRV